MVDLYIRNVDDLVHRKFKAQAAAEGIPLAEEFRHLVENAHIEKRGAAGWLAGLKPIRLGPAGKDISKRIDELATEAAWDDYSRYKYTRR